MQKEDKNNARQPEEQERKARRKLTVEELENRVAPSVADKKLPIPPPYAPGTDYGLLRRDNLSW
ncbi:MAG: hypothetical protein JXA30_04965 [Deltaproteobacteria bacterium]|nr:hypothetical protein [Deltaproteobacteria bacterium]